MNQAPIVKVAYFAGVITTSTIVLICIAFFGYRIGFVHMLKTLWKIALPPRVSASQAQPPQDVVQFPQQVLDELIALEAVVTNADNPTKARMHDTMLVRPDKQLGYILRSNVQVSAFTLRSQKNLNLDPPVLYLTSDLKVSSPLNAYLNENSRLSYPISTDSAGFRSTTPDVKSSRNVLIIGDSVAFGLGVNDDSTIASYLQRLIGSSHKVVNAGVGGYTGNQVVEMATKLSKEDTFDALIYVACENDFWIGNSQDAYLVAAKDILKKIAALKHRYAGKVIVMLETYLYHSANDILLEAGFSNELVAKTNVLREGLPSVAHALGFDYIDWMEIVHRAVQEQRTIFAPFALYVDHVHLSPQGNRLTAERLYKSLKKLAVVNSGSRPRRTSL